MIWSLTLPAITIGLYLAPVLIRSLRSSMLESLHAEYVEAARARGLSEARILRRYVLRTSLIATVTIVGVNLGFLISGSVVVENVFAIPGIGSLLVDVGAASRLPADPGPASCSSASAVVALSVGTDLVNTHPRPADPAVTQRKSNWLGPESLAAPLAAVPGARRIRAPRWLGGPGHRASAWGAQRRGADPADPEPHQRIIHGSAPCRPRSATRSGPTTSAGTCSRGSIYGGQVDLLLGIRHDVRARWSSG